MPSGETTAPLPGDVLCYRVAVADMPACSQGERETGSPWKDELGLEMYSSAVTLSDMEMFVFPELLYALVLANIMSPRLWRWREDPWFRRIGRLSPGRRIMRLKQYIMDNYDFNLDLETWGLTRKQRELERFRKWIDPRVIAESNALFGYEGDRYYFDLDIRRHFGLDKYDGDVIPYWKTETLEAMDAFRFRPGYARGAGECVSLSALYAAAVFVVCGISLDDIFIMTTPLHSQNFVVVGDGLITNNRRVLTKTMWFNGSELSMKARRALRHERVTLVGHRTGYIHQVYQTATISEEAYRCFRERLTEFLQADPAADLLINFLRAHRDYQNCFQISHRHHGRTRYIPLEVAFHYEHGRPYRLNDRTRDQLLAEIDEMECFAEPIEDRVCLEEFGDWFRRQTSRAGSGSVDELARLMDCQRSRLPQVMRDLTAFLKIEPRLPDPRCKRFVTRSAIEIDPDMSREEIVDRLENARAANAAADLAFYAFRDLSICDWRPFLKAAVERNPVILEGTADMSDQEAFSWLCSIPDESIYDGTRLAQPDEVWNFKRGDGVEKALCAADVLRHRHPGKAVMITVMPDRAVVECAGILKWEFVSRKGLQAELIVDG